MCRQQLREGVAVGDRGVLAAGRAHADLRRDPGRDVREDVFLGERREDAVEQPFARAAGDRQFAVGHCACLASEAAAERRYVAEVGRSWIVGRFDRVRALGADGCAIDVRCAWKLGHDPILGAALADEPAEVRLLGLTPRAERPRLLFGHAHYLLLGWACGARTGSIIDTSRGVWRTPARCRWPIAASDSAAAAVTADSAQAVASRRFGPGLQTRGILGVAVTISPVAVLACRSPTCAASAQA